MVILSQCGDHGLGCKDDQFLIPHDIAMDSEGYIYVTDSGKSHFRADYDCNQSS